MKTPILFIFAVTAAFLVSVNSCTKTVTQTKEVDSTIRDTTRDTTHDTAGPALYRFLSMFPDAVGSELLLYTTPDGSGNGITVSNAQTAQYFPVSPTTSLKYYLFLPNQPNCIDTIYIPVLGGGSINTFAIFDNSVNGKLSAISIRANDSAKLTPPPPGFCYLRFANGVADYPTPYPLVFLYLDDSVTSVFRSGGHDAAISFTNISPYVLIPSGRHLVSLKDSPPPSGTTVYQFGNGYLFQDGYYYTAHITGSQTNSTVVPRIDQELQ